MVEYTYNAWGYHTVSGSLASTVGAINPFRYRSYFYDTETKLYFLKTRYYDPLIGRFLNMDSIAYADPETINGLNLYAYCGNNPVMGYDPSGNFVISIGAALSLLAIAAGAAVLGWIESTFHPIQNTIEFISDGIADIIDDIQFDNDSCSYLKETGIANSIQLEFNNSFNIYFSRERNRGRDSEFRNKSNDELIIELNKAKQMGDSARIQRILKEMKMRGMRNTRKQRGGPHMRGILFLLLDEMLLKDYLYEN